MAQATIQIEDGKGDYIVINAADFDEKTMKKYNEKAAAPEPKRRGRPKKKEE